MLEIINSLLSHLRVSVTRNLPSSIDEQLYQEALINALGEFANHLPDYQKIEIMMFIMSKVPYSEPDSTAVGKGDVLLQSILLKSLLKVRERLISSKMDNRDYYHPGVNIKTIFSNTGRNEVPNDSLEHNVSDKLLGSPFTNVAGSRSGDETAGAEDSAHSYRQTSKHRKVGNTKVSVAT